jgi:hypothetical protein
MTLTGLTADDLTEFGVQGVIIGLIIYNFMDMGCLHSRDFRENCLKSQSKVGCPADKYPCI